MTSTGSSPRGSPGQPQPGLRLETAIRLGGVIFALVVAAATASGVPCAESRARGAASAFGTTGTEPSRTTSVASTAFESTAGARSWL